MGIKRVFVGGVIGVGVMALLPVMVASAVSTWDNVEPAVFNAGVQNASPDGWFNSVSCPSAGNCVGVGGYKNTSGQYAAFTATMTNGVWGTSTPVTFGAGVQNATPDDYLQSVSCGAVGFCVAGGTFNNAAGSGHEAFTVTMTNGVWGTATPVTFAGGLQNSNPNTWINTVSCASVGNCTVAGAYKDPTPGFVSFTMSLTNGAWASPVSPTFGAGVHHAAFNDDFLSISCVSAGNCTTVGRYRKVTAGYTVFGWTSTNGTWANAAPIAFAGGVENSTPDTYINSVSCASAGNCSAGGWFKNATGGVEAYVASQSGGTWSTAAPLVFAGGVQNTTPDAGTVSVSCPSAGNCVGAGYFKNASGNYQPMTVTSSNGTWSGAVVALFGAGVQAASPNAGFNSVSCSSVGNCTAVGYYTNSAGARQPMTMTSVNGVWGNAEPAVFGAVAQHVTPYAQFTTVSCASAGQCVTGGYFKNATAGWEALSMKNTIIVPATTTTVASTTTTVVSTPVTVAAAATTTTVLAKSSTVRNSPSVMPVAGTAHGVDLVLVGAALAVAGWLLLSGSRRRRV